MNAGIEQMLAEYAAWTPAQIPPGHYAVPIFRGYIDGHDEDTDEHYDILGYHLIHKFERGGVARRIAPVDGVDLDRLMAVVDHWNQFFGSNQEPLRECSDDDLGRHHRETYGRFTGMCGLCGRKLTDPESIRRGIGPQCWKAVS